jgi:hypothetical protein
VSFHAFHDDSLNFSVTLHSPWINTLFIYSTCLHSSKPHYNSFLFNLYCFFISSIYIQWPKTQFVFLSLVLQVFYLLPLLMYWFLDNKFWVCLKIMSLFCFELVLFWYALWSDLILSCFRLTSFIVFVFYWFYLDIGLCLVYNWIRY